MLLHAYSIPVTLAIQNQSEADRRALLCLKSQIRDPSEALVSWRDNSLAFCEWHGVTCGTRHMSRVIALDLESENITGEIFPCVADLSFLTRIHMPGNHIIGSIGQEIGQLTRLQYINLSMNSIRGSIPQNLGNSKYLRWVNFQNNSISGGIPAALFNSTSLSYLDLSHNNLSGLIPPFSQTSFLPLEYLSLTENNLSGEIPHSVGNLSTLSKLILGYNNLYGTIPESLSKLDSLQVLDLNHNNLSGYVPPAVYNISSLTYLGFAFNHLVGILPTNFGYTLPNIKELILAVNQFDGPIPASLDNATNLQDLDLHSNAFTDVIPPLGSLTMLSFLDLGMNSLEAGDWTFLSSLTSCRQLQGLWLDTNKLQGIIPGFIKNMSESLEELVLAENQLTGSIPLEMGNFTNLSVLIMHKNLLSGNIPDTLGKNLQNLAILGLYENKLSGEIPKSIGKLERLTELYFQENDLTGHIPASLAGCRSLLILNLSCNRLHGSIPMELFSISTLSLALDLSYNKISGEIPSEIGQCLLLDSLNMEVNLLNGSIPDTFISLRGITEIDLSRNLSGIIPSFFETFSTLKILNLSFNDLEGPLPLGGIFTNSSNAFFIQGNSKMCATSPIQQLPLCVTSPPTRKKITYIVAVLVPLSTLLAVTLASVAITILKRRKIKLPRNQSLKKFKNLSYADLFNATDGFSPNYLIGSGRFGLVYKGRFNSGIGSAAIKVFKPDQLGGPSNFLSECEALRNIRHRNLIKVISLCSTLDPTGNEFKALILKYMVNGNLECWLHPKDYGQSTSLLSLGSRIGIAVDIAAALDYLHCRCTPPLVHCDLKPSNVLLDDEMVACLSDFGLAKFLHPASSMVFKDSSSIV
ncbi:hypothetical protein HU200_008065 [Digitaria exilis]|uniref:Protein kinase domain-containing protein n=1 Tax=Digitaria exilis TaxID=1010633 RepID=A0A835KRZ5_9POAL|nr:hypothetical protein HU200_008065 [Digitaria exilis]